MLTKKQKELLIYIHTHMEGTDVAPSFEEMKLALGLKSKSGIHRLITSLEERGYIKRLAHRARALEIIKVPEDVKNASQSPKGGATNAVVEGDNSDAVNIPLHGKIAAGTPIEAIRDEINTVTIPADMTGRSARQYALTVDGDSMIKAGIHNCDTVIIEPCTSAEPGTIIVALVDGEEVTLKRLRYAGKKIVLEPENDDYEPQILDPERVQIQGKLIGLMRTYH